MVFASLTSEPLQLSGTDKYDRHEYRSVLECCECMRDAGGQIDKVPGMEDLVAFIHLEIDFTFNALHGDRTINRMRRHLFASRKNNPHDFEALLLEQRRGRSLLKHVAER